MLRFWKHRILEKKLYCAECRAITSHGVLSKEPFSVRGEIPPDIPLVCQCGVCESFFAVFSKELYFGDLRQNEDYAKLLSRSRLSPGDWLYVDGKSRPGKIDAVYNTNEEDVVVLNFGEGRSEKFTRPALSQFDTAAPMGYRLLPAQIGQTLLGDPVYHVLRKAIGTVVGTVVDGDLEKRVVQLENGKILFITLPEENQPLPDSVLLCRLNEKLSFLDSKLLANVKANVVHNIAYVYGAVPRYLDKEKIIREVNNLQEFRGVIDLLQVNVDGVTVPDADLRNQALRILESAESPLFSYEVSVCSGAMTVNAYCLAGKSPEKIRERLCRIEGLNDISLELEEVPEPPAEMVKRAENLKKILSENPKYSKYRYHVIPLEDGIVVEGCVENVLQKSLFNIAVIRAAKGVKVSTRLRVETDRRAEWPSQLTKN